MVSELLFFPVKKNLSTPHLLYALLTAACITAGEQDFSLGYFNPLYPLNPYREKGFVGNVNYLHPEI